MFIIIIGDSDMCTHNKYRLAIPAWCYNSISLNMPMQYGSMGKKD